MFGKLRIILLILVVISRKPEIIIKIIMLAHMATKQKKIVLRIYKNFDFSVFYGRPVVESKQRRPLKSVTSHVTNSR